MSDQPDIRLQMLSNTHFLAGARELVGQTAKRLGFSDEAAGHITLATDEALCNVIRHGYDRASDRPIWLSVYVLGGAPASLDPRAPAGGAGGAANPGCCGANPTTGLKIVIEDEAKQVDLSKIKSRDLDEVRPGGLGVHIITEVMDSVNWEHREGGKGMRLTMTKHKNSTKGPGLSPPAACTSTPSPARGARS